MPFNQTFALLLALVAIYLVAVCGAAGGDPQCNGNGIYYSGICACFEGYIGYDCRHPTCFGVAANDPFVCSGRGICTEPEYCLCESPYLGRACEFNLKCVEHEEMSSTSWNQTHLSDADEDDVYADCESLLPILVEGRPGFIENGSCIVPPNSVDGRSFTFNKNQLPKVRYWITDPSTDHCSLLHSYNELLSTQTPSERCLVASNHSDVERDHSMTVFSSIQEAIDHCNPWEYNVKMITVQERILLQVNYSTNESIVIGEQTHYQLVNHAANISIVVNTTNYVFERVKPNPNQTQKIFLAEGFHVLGLGLALGLGLTLGLVWVWVWVWLGFGFGV